MPEALIPVLRRVLPPGAGVGWADPGTDYPLLPAEALPRATPTRLREFAAGRHAARLAMAQIGLPPAAIPRGPDRAPVWPDGVIGSISHTVTSCIAVALRGGDGIGIGIDLEPATPLPAPLWDTVLLPGERAALARLPAAGQGLFALRVFCAKEAAFKAQYPLTQALVGFEAMAITFTDDRFTGSFQTALPPFGAGAQVQGHILHRSGHILALALL